VAAVSRDRLVEAFQAIASDLTRQRRCFALIGGMAVSARCEPRLTRDIDLVVAVSSDAEAKAVVYRLQAKGYSVLAVLEHSQPRRLATVRLGPPGPGRTVIVDLLFASSGIEREVATEADVVEIVSGLALPVAQVGHLLALKLLARDDRKRPQDYDDLKALLGVADASELRRAERALDLVTRRGFNRGRDLKASWKRTLRTLRAAARR